MIELAREPVVIGMGGNIGSQEEIIERFRRAREAIAELGDVRSAPLYLTAPIGPEQAAFLNTAIRVDVADLQPGELIATLLEVERLLGRQREREERWGPRPIDLDVLLWGARVVRSPELEVPHPRLGARRFALQPLADLFPAAEIPGLGPVSTLLERVRGQALEHIAASW